MRRPFLPLLLTLSATAFAAPPGGGAQAPAADPVDAIYAKNLLANPGFEDGGIAKERVKKGWYAKIENGMGAKIESVPGNKPEKPFEGRKALHIFVKDPVHYSKKALLGDWDTFAKGANGGKGPPKVDVQQFVRVKPGTKYALRLRWRASGLYNCPVPGPDRGFVGATFRCDWADSKFNYVSGTDAIPPKQLQSPTEDSDEWVTLAYPDFAPEGELPFPKNLNVPFAAPPGATYARIIIRFVCQRPKVRPEIWVDQVEFVEVPPGVDPAPVAQANAPAAPAPAKPADPNAAPAPAKPADPNAAPAPAKPAAASGAGRPPAGPAPATTVKDGGVLKLKDCGGAEFLPAIHLAGWKGSAKLESPDPAVAAALAGFFSYMAGDVRIRGAASFAAAPDGSLRASWTFTPAAEVDLALLGVCLRLATDGFAGGSLLLDGAEVALPAECGENPRLFSGNASSVSVRDATGRERFSFAFDAPTRISLQDNRHWKGTQFEFRIHSQSPSPFPADSIQAFSFTLRGGAPAAPAE